MNLAEIAEHDLAERGVRDWLWFEERWYTNRELHDASCRLASALAARGLAADDKVVVMMGNCPEVLISFPAIWRIGAIVIPVLHVLDASELAYILKDSGAKAIITSADLGGKVQKALATSTSQAVVIAVTEHKEQVSPPVLSFEALIADSAPRAEVTPRTDDDLAVVLYTSGTTGRPKGVMQTHRNLIANAESSWEAAKSTRNPDELRLLALPLAHSFGLSSLIEGFMFGPRAVLMRRFVPRDALHLIQRHRIARMSGVPTMFMYMLGVPDPYDTSSVYMWIVGAAPMPFAQIEQFEQRFGGTMYVGYGLTEASPSLAAEREGEPRKPGSTGRALAGVELKIVDDAGNALPPGEVGEICARGPNITPGYLGMPEATAEAIRDGWFHTGDLGYLDEDAYLFVVGRKKDLIIRGGLNIYPSDVESALATHPAVSECAVVGVPDPVLGEQVCACVVLAPDTQVSAEALIRHTQERLAKYKTPSYVEFMSELPKNSLGKVLKKDLRSMLAAKYAPSASASHAPQ